MKYYILLIILSPIMSTQWFIGAILGGIGSLIGLGTGIANTVSNINTANKNNQISDQQNQLSKDAFEWQKSFAEQQFNYQKEQNELTRQREDNAIQRRAADLEAAGLSKTLAAGSPAQASTVSAGGSNNVNSPTLSKREAWKVENLNAIATGLELANAYEEIQNKRSQNNVNNAKVGEILANAGLLDEKQKTELVNRLVGRSIANLNNSKAETENYNRNYSKDRNMRTTDSTDTRYNTAKSAAGDAEKAVKEYFKDAVPIEEYDPKKEPEYQQGKDYLDEQIYRMSRRWYKADDIVSKLWDQIPGKTKEDKLRYVMDAIQSGNGNYR